MPHDPLDTLIRVRQLACDAAGRQLSAALAEEERALRSIHAAERAIADEMAAAQSPDSTDAMVEAFGAWLPGARRKLAAARQDLAGRQADIVRCRAELTICKTALESVQTLQGERRQAAEQRRERSFERELADRPARRAPE